MMETLSSTETSVPTRATRRNIPEDGILYVLVSLLAYQKQTPRSLVRRRAVPTKRPPLGEI
jgi:hypothetical protein